MATKYYKKFLNANPECQRCAILQRPEEAPNSRLFYMWIDEASAESILKGEVSPPISDRRKTATLKRKCKRVVVKFKRKCKNLEAECKRKCKELVAENKRLKLDNLEKTRELASKKSMIANLERSSQSTSRPLPSNAPLGSPLEATVYPATDSHPLPPNAPLGSPVDATLYPAATEALASIIASGHPILG